MALFDLKIYSFSFLYFAFVWDHAPSNTVTDYNYI
jgi:hypothetical protein